MDLQQDSCCKPRPWTQETARIPSDIKQINLIGEAVDIGISSFQDFNHFFFSNTFFFLDSPLFGLNWRVKVQGYSGEYLESSLFIIIIIIIIIFEAILKAVGTPNMAKKISHCSR